MKSDKITRLISALGKPSYEAALPEAKAKGANGISGQANADAVKIAVGFGKAVDQTEDTQREQKVERIKAQVQSGTYKPRSADVAVALIKDLGI